MIVGNMAVRTSMSQETGRSRASADWTSIGDGSHAVQFYSHDNILIDHLGRYVGTSLVSGESALIATTPARRDDLERHLRMRGLDTSVARSEGRYVFIDAADALRGIVSGNRVSRDAFARAIDEPLERIAALGGDSRRIAVFGEMVSMLWMARQTEAAIRLEELWNELCEQHAFSLCCAYPMHGFGDAADPGPFLRICALHSHVFPAERRTIARV